MEFSREARERFVPDAAALVMLGRGFVEVFVEINEVSSTDTCLEHTVARTKEPMIDPLGPKRLSPDAQAEMDEFERKCALDDKLERRARVARMLGRGPRVPLFTYVGDLAELRKDFCAE